MTYLSNRNSTAGAEVAGRHTLTEILSQPQCWDISLRGLDSETIFVEICRQFDGTKEPLFIGCGSSYYVALSAAATWRIVTGRRAHALPASELLLCSTGMVCDNIMPFLISRSGRTSEVLRAGQLLQQTGSAIGGITCNVGQALKDTCNWTLELTSADENSVVMTRSFTSMLMVLQYLAARVAGDVTLTKGLRAVSQQAEYLLNTIATSLRDFVEKHTFADYICLGHGPLYGIACEIALKIAEMSRSYAQCYHTLEFRHGPKSVVSPETLIVFLLSEFGYDAEQRVLEEVKRLNAKTLVIANTVPTRIRGLADVHIELNSLTPEVSRSSMYVIPGQLLGLYTGLEKGLDPDHPPNLTQVVVLD